MLRARSGELEDAVWEDLRVGDLVLVQKNHEVPADILLLRSANANGIAYANTMNLDGETNLKEKFALASSLPLNQERRPDVAKITSATLTYEAPNNLLTSWQGCCGLVRNDIEAPAAKNGKQCELKNLILRGCFLKNTEWCLGIVVYVGHNTKIMKNARQPKSKASSVLQTMNVLLYSLLTFQLVLIIVFASLNIQWRARLSNHAYLNLDSSPDAGDWFTQFLTYWVAYSHLIPISLYVMLEIVKLGISRLINVDSATYRIVSPDRHVDILSHPMKAQCRTSDLVEELGQIDLIFSDKTGTLTRNEMEMRRYCTAYRPVLLFPREMRIDNRLVRTARAWLVPADARRHTISVHEGPAALSHGCGLRGRRRQASV